MPEKGSRKNSSTFRFTTFTIEKVYILISHNLNHIFKSFQTTFENIVGKEEIAVDNSNFFFLLHCFHRIGVN